MEYTKGNLTVITRDYETRKIVEACKSDMPLESDINRSYIKMIFETNNSICGHCCHRHKSDYKVMGQYVFDNKIFDLEVNKTFKNYKLDKDPFYWEWTDDMMVLFDGVTIMIIRYDEIIFSVKTFDATYQIGDSRTDGYIDKDLNFIISNNGDVESMITIKYLAEEDHKKDDEEEEEEDHKKDDEEDHKKDDEEDRKKDDEEDHKKDDEEDHKKDGEEDDVLEFHKGQPVYKKIVDNFCSIPKSYIVNISGKQMNRREYCQSIALLKKHVISNIGNLMVKTINENTEVYLDEYINKNSIGKTELKCDILSILVEIVQDEIQDFYYRRLNYNFTDKFRRVLDYEINKFYSGC